MKQKTYVDNVTADYIKQNLEHRDVFEMESFIASVDKGFKYSDLKTADTEDKMPLAYYKDKQGNMRVCFTPNSHRLTIGSTGAGKSTYMAIPDIKSLCRTKVKPDLFVIDVKGEIRRETAGDLIAVGYDVFVLNFKDSRKSHSYNYLASITDDIDLATFSKLKPTEQNYIRLEAQAKINNLVANLITVEGRDPYWDLSAQDLTSGMLCWMLEMFIEGKITATQFNVKTFYELMSTCISKATRGSDFTLNKIKELDPYKNHSFYNSLKSSFENADTTRQCIFGITKTKLKGIFSSKSFALSYTSSFEATQGDKPKAIFVIINAMDDAEFDFCRIVIDDFYGKLIKQAGSLTRERLVRPMHYFLDEFGNINKIANFQKKMALARSYNIFFHLFIQSYAQLSSVYGKDTNTILNNCLTQVFLSCSDYHTCEVFAAECGKKTIKTLTAQLDPESLDHTQVNCVPISRLLDMRLGQACIRRKGEPVLFASLLASWGEPEFAPKGESIFPKNELSYDDEKYCYKLGTETKSSKRTFDFDFDYGDDDKKGIDCDCDECKGKKKKSDCSSSSSPKKRSNFFDFLDDEDEEEEDEDDDDDFFKDFLEGESISTDTDDDEDDDDFKAFLEDLSSGKKDEATVRQLDMFESLIKDDDNIESKSVTPKATKKHNEVYDILKTYIEHIELAHPWRKKENLLLKIKDVVIKIITTTEFREGEKLAEIASMMKDSADAQEDYSSTMRLVYGNTALMLKKVSCEDIVRICNLVLGQGEDAKKMDTVNNKACETAYAKRFAEIKGFIELSATKAGDTSKPMLVDEIATPENDTIKIYIRKGKDGFYFTDEGSCYKALDKVFKMDESEVKENLNKIAKRFNVAYVKSFVMPIKNLDDCTTAYKDFLMCLGFALNMMIFYA